MRILNTAETSVAIEEILDKARRFVVLVSPYTKIAERIVPKIEAAAARCSSFILLTRPDAGNSIGEGALSISIEAGHIKIATVKNLHAKCYLNESSVVLTSLNLYEYSQINNFELGVLLDRVDDEAAYIKILDEIRAMATLTPLSKTMDSLLEDAGIFTMGKLASELTGSYMFPDADNETGDALYRYLCDEARKEITFSNDQLYEDGSRVLRRTQLTKDQYTHLLNRLAARGKPRARRR